MLVLAHLHRSVLTQQVHSLGHLAFKWRSSFAKALAKLSPNFREKIPNSFYKMIHIYIINTKYKYLQCNLDMCTWTFAKTLARKKKSPFQKKTLAETVNCIPKGLRKGNPFHGPFAQLSYISYMDPRDMERHLEKQYYLGHVKFYNKIPFVIDFHFNFKEMLAITSCCFSHKLQFLCYSHTKATSRTSMCVWHQRPQVTGLPIGSKDNAVTMRPWWWHGILKSSGTSFFMFFSKIWSKIQEIHSDSHLLILLMEEILHQLVGGVSFSPIIYRVLYIPGGCFGFLLSTVLQYFDFRSFRSFIRYFGLTSTRPADWGPCHRYHQSQCFFGHNGGDPTDGCGYVYLGRS